MCAALAASSFLLASVASSCAARSAAPEISLPSRAAAACLFSALRREAVAVWAAVCSRSSSRTAASCREGEIVRGSMHMHIMLCVCVETRRRQLR